MSRFILYCADKLLYSYEKKIDSINDRCFQSNGFKKICLGESNFRNSFKILAIKSKYNSLKIAHSLG